MYGMRKSTDAVQLLQKDDLTNEHRKQLIDEAFEDNGEEYVVDCILSHCSEAEVDNVIGMFLSRGLWQALANMLQWSYLNDKQRAEVIEGAANVADDLNFHTRIVPNSPSVEKQPSVEWFIRNGCWAALGRLLKREYIATDKRDYVFGKAAELADEKGFFAIVLPFCTREEEKSSILPHCCEVEVDNVIGTFLSRGMWQALANMLQWRSLNDKQRAEVIEGAANLADDMDFYERIVPNSPSVEKQPSVEWLIRNSCWAALGRLLKREYISKDQRNYVVRKADELADEKSFPAIALPVCTREGEKSSILHLCSEAEVDNVIGMFVSRGMWQALASMLQWRNLNDKQRAEVIEGAANLADDLDFYKRIVPNSPSVEKQPSVEWFIRNGCWAALGRLLKREYIATDKRNYVFGKAAELADEKSFPATVLPFCTREGEKSSILPHYSEPEVDTVIRMFLSRGMWQALASVLQLRNLNDKQRAEVIEGAANLADDLDFYERIVPNSPSVEKQPSVEWLIRNSCWAALGRLLKREYISKDQRNYVVRKADELADEKSFPAIALPVCTREGEKSSILHLCSEAEVDNVIGMFVSRGMWQALASMLQWRNLNDKQRAEVIEGAANLADDLDFYKRIVPNSPSVEKQPSVEWFIRNGCWAALGRLLKREYIATDKRNYVFGKAAELADEKSFPATVLPFCTREGEKSSILPHYSEPEVDTVIRMFLSRGMWQALASVLQLRNLNDKQRAEVIEGAANLADDLDFYERIVPNSPSVKKQPSVEWFIRNGCWAALGRLLKGEYIAKDKRDYVVRKAAELSDEKSFLAIVLPFCKLEEEKSSILKFVQNSCWSMIDCLESEIPNELLGYMLSWAAEHADSRSFTRWILPKCDRDQTKQVATRLIKTNCIYLKRWFQQKSNVDERQDILKIGLTKGGDKTFIDPFFSACSVSELYYLVVQLAMKGWNVALFHLIYNIERRKGLYMEAKRKGLFEVLSNYGSPGVSALSPMAWAIRLGQPVVMRLLYESGCPSNAMLHTLRMDIEAKASAQDKPKYLSFLRKVTTTPRTLKSLCRRAILRCLTEQDSVCHKDVETLPLRESLKKYMMFSTETDPEDCKLWFKENDCYSNYVWAL